MKFTVKVWVLKFTFDFFDTDPSDGNVAFGVTISWK